MLQVLIDEETVFHGGIPRILEKQKTAGFTIDVMEEPLDTDPVAVKAKRFVTYE
jgi:ribonucleotide monophosphatase NagD (HAD superfamily)